jgi:hypothetical protein
MLVSLSTGDESIGDDIELDPGRDADGSPSIRLIFDVNAGPGIFTIDTCCVAGFNHLLYADRYAQERAVNFNRGIIGIDASVVGPTCYDRLVDANCDGMIDIRDIVTTIDVAFRGFPLRLIVECMTPPARRASVYVGIDISVGCPACFDRLVDANCDGKIDILDVVTTIDVAYRHFPLDQIVPCTTPPPW